MGANCWRSGHLAGTVVPVLLAQRRAAGGLSSTGRRTDAAGPRPPGRGPASLCGRGDMGANCWRSGHLAGTVVPVPPAQRRAADGLSSTGRRTDAAGPRPISLRPADPRPAGRAPVGPRPAGRGPASLCGRGDMGANCWRSGHLAGTVVPVPLAQRRAAAGGLSSTGRRTDAAGPRPISLRPAGPRPAGRAPVGPRPAGRGPASLSPGGDVGANCWRSGHVAGTVVPVPLAQRRAAAGGWSSTGRRAEAGRPHSVGWAVPQDRRRATMAAWMWVR